MIQNNNCEIELIKNKLIIVWFSCGAASAIAAKYTLDLYGKNNRVLLVNNPIKEEHPDNLRFMADIEKWLNLKIIKHVNPLYPDSSIVSVFEKRKFMGNIKGSPCTMLLKKASRYDFEKNNDIDYHVLGFTADEKLRHDKFVKSERSNVLPVLINLGITKGRCIEILKEANIKIPIMYNQGFPNANCIGCVKSASPTYWNLVRKYYPEIYNERAKQSRRLHAKLVVRKGKRIYLDELKITDIGGKIKSFECGLFCND